MLRYGVILTDNITGKKVRINIDNFSNKKLSKKFKRFLKNNSNKIFTAILDVDNKYTSMYILKEDRSKPKWLFFIENLIIVEE